MKKTIILVCALFYILLSSCNKLFLGEAVTYWKCSGYILELNTITNTAYFYAPDGPGKYHIDQTKKINISENTIYFSDSDYGVLNYEKNQLYMFNSEWGHRLIEIWTKTTVEPNTLVK